MKKYALSICLSLLFISLASCQPAYASLTYAGSIWSYNSGNNINSIDISADGQYITTGTSGKLLFFFNRTSSVPLWNWTSPYSVHYVALSSDGAYLAMGATDFMVSNTNRFCLFATNTSTMIWNYTARDWLNGLDMASDGSKIVVGYCYGQLFLFNHTHVIPLINKSVMSYYTPAISEDGTVIAVGSNEGLNNNCKFYVFNATSAKELWNYYSYGQIGVIDLTPDGQYIVGGVDFGGNRTYLFNSSKNQPIWYHEAGAGINSVSISADGQYLCAGSNDNILYVFHQNSSTPLWNYTAGDIVTSVAISADGRFIAMGSYDDHLYFFNRSSSNPLWNYTFTSGVYRVSMDLNCEYIVAAVGNTIYLFNRNGTVTIGGGGQGIPGFQFLYVLVFGTSIGLLVHFLKTSKQNSNSLPFV
ncbi:MAG: hypothetical protein LUQ65_13770 [Candidatus Helarchaeota archaeon]|nr:hypothetical protein [Candidatus Helarchaeota archaeon]